MNVRGLPTAGIVLVEEYLDAPEFSVEMFGTHCVGITEKSVTGLPYFIEHRHIFPARLPEERAEELIRTVQPALETVGVRLGATHTEVKLTCAGPAIIEINPRPAGGMIPELIDLATGIDLVEQQLRAAAGLPVELAGEFDRTAGIQFLLAEREGRLAEVSGVDLARRFDGVVGVTVTARPGDWVRPARSAYDRLGHVIALGDKVERTLAAAHAEIQFHVDSG